MNKKTIFLSFLIFVTAQIILLCFNQQVLAISESHSGDFVITGIVPDDAGKILAVNGKNTGDVANYKVTRLNNPDRIVIDIPDAVLIGQKQLIDLANSGITNVKISQFSTNPDIVRLVFIADSKESLEKLTFHKTDKSLIFKLNEIEPPKSASSVVYQDNEINNNSAVTEQSTKQVKNLNNQNMVINTVNYVNNHLVLSGTGNLAIKEPFILHNPERIIYDLPNSTVSTNDLLKTYSLNNSDTVRIGQFDSDTLRVVIETNSPDNYKTVISPDLQSLTITPKLDINLSDLPNNKIPCLVQDINVKKTEAKTTVVTITATQPIIHSISHFYQPDRINLELYNVNAPKKSLISSLPGTNQFKGINIDHIEKYPSGSSWSFPVDRGIKVASALSVDGKMLELIFKETNTYQAANLSSEKARVVIDPGHGGNEPGASRGGYFEKDITLSVAKKVYKYLSNAGLDVIMTRNDDSTVSLKQRTDLTNSVNPDLFVSIHVNACASPDARGLETHWCTPQSLGLAKKVHSKLTSCVNSPNRGIMNSMFYVIHHTNVPAILVEIGFISNNEERTQLLSEERQETTAKAIAEGILQYLEMKD